MLHSFLKWQGIKSLQNDKNIIIKVKHYRNILSSFNPFQSNVCSMLNSV